MDPTAVREMEARLTSELPAFINSNPPFKALLADLGWSLDNVDEGSVAWHKMIGIYLHVKNMMAVVRFNTLREGCDGAKAI